MVILFTQNKIKYKRIGNDTLPNHWNLTSPERLQLCSFPPSNMVSKLSLRRFRRSYEPLKGSAFQPRTEVIYKSVG